MRALVTGGAGFIGSHIVEELLKEKADVVVLDDLSTGKKDNIQSPQAELFKGSVLDRDMLMKSMEGVDIVFHEAAKISIPFSVSHPATTWDVNIKGTKLMLNAAVNAGVKRVIFASSAEVYGNALPPLSEKNDVKPISPFGDSKRMGELLMEQYHDKEGLEAVSLRYFDVYGPRQNISAESGVVARFISMMSQGKAPEVYGTGMQTRDFVYVKDVARANMLALKMKKAKADVFNVASGNAISVSELVKTLNSVLGTALVPIFEPERQSDVKYSFADISLAKKKLGFEANVALEQGLKETVRWFKEKGG